MRLMEGIVQLLRRDHAVTPDAERLEHAQRVDLLHARVRLLRLEDDVASGRRPENHRPHVAAS